MSNIKSRVILVEGDSFLAIRKIKEIKGLIFPGDPTSAEWVEYEVPEKKQKTFMEETVNSIDAEISYPSWDGGRKVIYLRGLIDTKAFREILTRFARMVPDGNTLLVFDRDGIMSGSDWSDFRKLCRERGEVVNVGAPLSSLNDEAKENYVVEAFKSMGKVISKSDASFMLQLCMPDRGFILSEVEKIADCVDGERVTRQNIKDIIFPASPEYPVYLYYEEFFGGNYDRILHAANMLLSQGKPYDLILDMTTKILRWQLVAAHIMTYNRRDLRDSLWRYASQKNYSEIVSKLMARPELPREAFRLSEVSEDEKPNKKQDQLSKFMHEGVMESLGNFILSEVLAMKPKDPKQALCTFAMKRFLLAKEALVETRLAKPEHKYAVFCDAIRKLSRRKRNANV